MFKEIIYRAYNLIDNPGNINSVAVPKFHKTVQVHSMWMKNDRIQKLCYKPTYCIDNIIQDIVNGT